MSAYEKQAKDFLEKTDSKMFMKHIGYDFYFDWDKDKRDIYQIQLKRGEREYKFTFGQALTKIGKKPTEYDVLACLQGYDVVSFENFCGDFGYDTDSIKAFKNYEKVMDEYKNLCMLYSDIELEMLSEIQ